MLSLLAVLRRSWPGTDPRAHNQPPAPLPSAAPPQMPAQVPQPAPHDVAERLRREAHDALLRHDFSICKRDIEEAFRLDPSGESDETAADYARCNARGREPDTKR